MTLEELGHGTLGMVLGYGLALGGLLGGMILARAKTDQYLRAPLLALPVAIVAGLAWALVYHAEEITLVAWPARVSAFVAMAFIALVSALAGAVWVRGRSGVTLQRGTVLIESGWAERLLFKNSRSLTLAGVRVPMADETKHFKLIGTTGTGKSTAIRELLTGALERGDRAVIADPDGSYAKSFYTPNRRDVILNPFDIRSARWDLFAEILQMHDADQLARSLIPDQEGPERIWCNYGRTFLTAVLRQLHRLKEEDLTKLYYLLILAPPEELSDLLESTPAAPYLGRDNGKFFDSVRSVTSTHLAGLEHLARQSGGTGFSIRRWVRESQAGVVFLPYKANEIASLRNLISTWMRIAIFETMNAEEGDQKLWFAIDELDALGAIDGLKDALARLRKFGGRCALGFQSIAQVTGTYGQSDAQTIVENCGNTLILRCSASEQGGTARFASRLIGEREIVRQQVTESHRGGFLGDPQHSTSTSVQHVTEAAVLPSEIEQLPDLQGFLKLASSPQWRRVRLKSG